MQFTKRLLLEPTIVTLLLKKIMEDTIFNMTFFEDFSSLKIVETKFKMFKAHVCVGLPSNLIHMMIKFGLN